MQAARPTAAPGVSSAQPRAASRIGLAQAATRYTTPSASLPSSPPLSPAPPASWSWPASGGRAGSRGDVAATAPSLAAQMLAQNGKHGEGRCSSGSPGQARPAAPLSQTLAAVASERFGAATASILRDLRPLAPIPRAGFIVASPAQWKLDHTRPTPAVASGSPATSFDARLATVAADGREKEASLVSVVVATSGATASSAAAASGASAGAARAAPAVPVSTAAATAAGDAAAGTLVRATHLADAVCATSGAATTEAKDTAPLSRVLRRFRVAVGVVRAVARMQELTDARNALDEEEAVLIVRSIANTLLTDETYERKCKDIFDTLLTSSSGPQESLVHVLQSSQLPQLLNVWHIPMEHVSMLWALLWKECAHLQPCATPELIDSADLSSVLPRFLRRVRNMYSLHRASKQAFIRRRRSLFEDDYTKASLIGEGSFGACFWVEHNRSRRQLVCKHIKIDYEQVNKQEVETELDTMKRLDHPNVLRVYEWFETDRDYTLILEPAYGGDLKALLAAKSSEDRPGIEESLVQPIVTQVLRALAYMHSQGFVHRDIKPANVLLAKKLPEPYSNDDLNNLRVLVADFGVSELKSDGDKKKSDVKGTFLYMAPEVFAGDAGPKSDVWALGVLSFELLCGKRPLTGDNPMVIYAKLRKKDVDLEPVRAASASPSAVAFLALALVRDQAERQGAQELLTHPWIAGDEASTNGSTRTWRSFHAARRARRAFSGFKKKSSFARSVANCIAAQLDTANLFDLNNAFKNMDKNGDGVLSLEELRDGLHEVGFAAENIDSIADSMDINKDSTINYTEFVACLMDMDRRVGDDMVEVAFRVFDQDGNGSISADELRAVLSEDGPIAEVLPDGKTVEQVLEEIDSTPPYGLISMQEFKRYIRAQNQQGRRSSAELDAEAIGSECHRLSSWGDTAPMRTMSMSSSRGSASALSATAQTAFNPGVRGRLSCQQSQPPLASRGLVNIGDDDTLESVFAMIANQLKSSYNNSQKIPDYAALCRAHAARLADTHWLLTAGDLREVREGDWPRLELPLKLQNILKQHMCPS